MKKNISTLYLICCCSFVLQAAHIIGGEITYECTGNNNYRFTMKIYRDCNGGGAQFDGPNGSISAATVTIFRGTSMFRTIPVNSLTVSSVEPVLDNPCLVIPPNLCVEQGVYIFNSTLPLSTESYHISYQRCCRNNTINNIISPSTSGATYTVEITEQSQQNCNNSPVFTNFPPIVICAGDPLNFDHSANDPEGDELVYSFCSPFLGGGTDGSTTVGSPTSVTGVAPNPDAPPPYQAVQFITPEYSANQPMGGTPVVKINSTTGLITGTPMIQGQFVVGVCVEEYRNGQLIGSIQRDFQFNVSSCDPVVIADIQEDSIIGQQEFLVDICGREDAIIVNESTQEQNINEVVWTIDLGTYIDTIRTWDAELTFPDTGQYVAQLFLNQNLECSDFATIYINVFPSIEADFIFEYDTCVAGEVRFTDQSFSGSGHLTDWDWSLGDGNQSEEVNPSHLYEKPGIKNVTLEVVDTNNCRTSVTNSFSWLPVPEEIIVDPNIVFGCAPQTVLFDNLSSPINASYDIFWDFGDGNSSTEISPTHIYEMPGTYSVSLDITSPIGCFIGAEFPDFVSVRESPEAGFDYTPGELTNFNSTAYFTDKSERAVFWEWIFQDEALSYLQNPSHTFVDTGFYQVLQIVTHPNGCQDTAFRLLDVMPMVTYYLPNAFTPNGDGSNDSFLGQGIYDGMSDFQFSIWNRWGELVFQTDDPLKGWNGLKNNIDQPSPSGVYVCKVHYREPRGATRELKGFATLIR